MVKKRNPPKARAATKTTHEQGILKDPEKVEGTGVNTRRSDESRVIQSTDLRESAMMARLWDDLAAGVDIGHFGRLVFTMIGRHYIDEPELIDLLSKNFESVDEARALLLEVNARNYNPPRRDVILQWQERQEYKIIPLIYAHDLHWGNVYSELKLPKEIYNQVQNFYKEAAKVLAPEEKK